MWSNISDSSWMGMLLRHHSLWDVFILITTLSMRLNSPPLLPGLHSPTAAGSSYLPSRSRRPLPAPWLFVSFLHFHLRGPSLSFEDEPVTWNVPWVYHWQTRRQRNYSLLSLQELNDRDQSPAGFKRSDMIAYWSQCHLVFMYWLVV